MQYRSVKGFSPLGQLGILILFIFIGFILATGLQLVMAVKMLPEGISFTEPDAIKNAMLDPRNKDMARLLQVLSAFLLFFVPAVMYSFITNGKNIFFWLGMNRYFNVKQIVFAFLIIFAAAVISGPVSDLTKSVIANFPEIDKIAINLEKMYEEQVKAMSSMTSWPEFIVSVFIMAFFPALFEELFFRGAMQNIFVRWWGRPLAAIIFTSVVFSIFHFSIYGFVSRVVLSIALGWTYYRSKNIWLPIIGHFLNNLMVLINLFWMYKSGQKVDLESADPKLHWAYAVIALIALFFLIRLFNRLSFKNRERISAREEFLFAKNDTSDPFNLNSSRGIGTA